MEREFHSWLKKNSCPDPNVILGIGDDAAVLRGFDSPSGIVITTDAIADGTHFDIKTDAPQRIGRKAMAVCLSDLAAMGATPVAAVVTFQLPNDFTLQQVQELYLGCEALALQFSTPIVGGDTNRWAGKLTVSVTVIGHQYCGDGQTRSWTLDGANPTDQIVVTGAFGGSLLGHHFDFLPQNQLAEHLIGRYTISAATDVSDSLSLDLAQVAVASGVGVELEAERIPISEAAQTMATQSGKSPLIHALTDGEDFQLILAVPKTQWESLQKDPEYGKDLTRVGQFVSPPGFRLIQSGSSAPFLPQGYSH